MTAKALMIALAASLTVATPSAGADSGGNMAYAFVSRSGYRAAVWVVSYPDLSTCLRARADLVMRLQDELRRVEIPDPALVGPERMTGGESPVLESRCVPVVATK